MTQANSQEIRYGFGILLENCGNIDILDSPSLDTVPVWAEKLVLMLTKIQLNAGAYTTWRIDDAVVMNIATSDLPLGNYLVDVSTAILAKHSEDPYRATEIYVNVGEDSATSYSYEINYNGDISKAKMGLSDDGERMIQEDNLIVDDADLLMLREVIRQLSGGNVLV